MRTALWGCWKKINKEQEVRRENGATKSVSKMWTWKRCDGLGIFFLERGSFSSWLEFVKIFELGTAGPWKKKDWTLLSCTWYAIKALQHFGLRMERWGEIPFHETGHRYLSGWIVGPQNWVTGLKNRDLLTPANQNLGYTLSLLPPPHRPRRLSFQPHQWIKSMPS